MKNLLIILSLLLTVITARAEDVTVVARIHSVKDAEKAFRLPVILENEGLTAVLTKLDPEDEVILKGRVEYHPVTHEGRTEMNPTFHVEKLIPVSLAKIGKMEFVPVETKMRVSQSPAYAPKTIGVSGKVAQAMTLTASLLMLKELSGNQKSQPQTDQLNTGLIFSAGVLATGVYLWEQLKNPKDDR